MNSKKPHKNIKARQDSGFTLVEIMIAIGIFAIGFLAVGLMQINAMSTTNSARRITEALTLADDRAEQLRALPFYDADADLDGVGGIEDFDVHPDLQPAGIAAPHEDNVAGPYTVRWTVTDDVPLDPYDDGVLATHEVHRSKTIRIWVTPDNNANDIQADIVFSKFMTHDDS